MPLIVSFDAIAPTQSPCPLQCPCHIVERAPDRAPSSPYGCMKLETNQCDEANSSFFWALEPKFTICPDSQNGPFDTQNTLCLKENVQFRPENYFKTVEKTPKGQIVRYSRMCPPLCMGEIGAICPFGVFLNFTVLFSSSLIFLFGWTLPSLGPEKHIGVEKVPFSTFSYVLYSIWDTQLSNVTYRQDGQIQQKKLGNKAQKTNRTNFTGPLVSLKQIFGALPVKIAP